MLRRRVARDEMSAGPEKSILLTRLESLRRTVRRRLIGYGACAVLAGGVVSFLTIVTLDSVFWLPPALRLAVGAAFFLGFVAASWYWVVKPLQASLEIVQIAGRLERHFDHLGDRLSSAVSFLSGDQPGSKAMMRQVIENTERIVADLPIESVVAMRPLAMRVVWLAVSASVLLSLVAISPNWVRTGFYRYVYPTGSIEWPRRVEIVPRTGDAKVALGESFTVRMDVERGLTSDLRAVVYTQSPGREVQPLALRRGADGSFSATIDAVGRNLEYWFEAGDDTTADRPFALTVVRRPAIVEAFARIIPPSYAASGAVRVRDLTQGPVEVVRGSIVEFQLRSSKEIARSGEASLQFDSGGSVALEIPEADRTFAAARVPVDADVRVRPVIRDVDGFENHGAAEYSLRAVVDAFPRIAVSEPAALVEVTPGAKLDLVARVQDDFGVRSIALRASRLSGGSVFSADLTDQLQVIEAGERYEALVRWSWDLGGLSLRAGDALEYQLEAIDTFSDESTSGQMGVSSPLRIKVISELEFDTRVRSDLVRMESRVRKVLLGQQALLQRARVLEADSDEEAVSARNREEALSQASDQARISRTLAEIGDAIDAIAARVQRSREEDTKTLASLRGLVDSAREIAQLEMTPSADALNRFASANSREDADALAESARAKQDEAIRGLDEMLRRLSEWGHFQGVVTRARDLLDRQQTLREDTRSFAKETLGRRAEELSEEQSKRLAVLRRRQQQLGGELKQFLERMEALAREGSSESESAAEVAAEAGRTAKAHDVERRAEEATAALDQNRSAAATIEQKAVSQGLRAVLRTLREKESRELAALRKKLEDAREQVAMLLERQVDLRLVTEEASGLGASPERVTALAGDQARLSTNTQLLADDLVRKERMGDASQALQEATPPMERARGGIATEDYSTALTNQDEAIARLEDVLALLDVLAEEAAEESLRRSLQQIRDDLQEILAQQQEVDEGVQALVEKAGADDRLDRRDAREASKLARTQRDVLTGVAALQPDFEQVIVYRWAMDRVASWMEEVARALTERRVDGALSRTSARILREIQRLIDAIDETETLPMDTQFIEQAGSQGQGGGQAGGKPVPTVAELLVLKAMQLDLNERTRALDDRVGEAAASESELDEMTELGQDQARILDLAGRLTEKARE